MKHRLELELDVITDLSPLEIATKVEQAVSEAIERAKQSLGTDLLAPVYEVYETETLTFFDFPIKQFADRSTRWLLQDGENVQGLLEKVNTFVIKGQI